MRGAVTWYFSAMPAFETSSRGVTAMTATLTFVSAESLYAAMMQMAPAASHQPIPCQLLIGGRQPHPSGASILTQIRTIFRRKCTEGDYKAK